MLAVLGHPATRFFEVKSETLFLLEIIIFIIGIIAASYVVKNRGRNNIKELRGRSEYLRSFLQ